MALILTREDVIAVLKMDECIEVVEQAFIELAEDTVTLPLRSVIPCEGGVSLYMPAYLKKASALACKVVTVFKDNPENFNMPTTLGKVLLQDPETGDVTSIMDGGYLTAMRTGAVSGVATRHLARKDKGQVVGIFGAGVQARMQLWAMAEVRDIKSVLVYDVSSEAKMRFIKEMGEQLGVEILEADTVEKMLESDIICTATSSATPLFPGDSVKPGTHINGIGSHSPEARELDAEIIKKSKLVGDSAAACWAESGDLIIPFNEGLIKKEHLYAELGEIVSGGKSGRTNQKEITLFKSNGIAIQDAATAKLVYDRAVEAGIGRNVEI